MTVEHGRWVTPVTLLVLVALVASTIVAVLVARSQLDDQLVVAATDAAETFRSEVELNLQRDVAAAAGLALSLEDPGTVDADAWLDGVDALARAGAFTDVSAVNLLLVASAEDVGASIAALPASVRSSLDVRLSDGPMHAVVTAVWPSDPNVQVLGYDVFENEVSNIAVTAALRAEAPRASPPVQVLQEPDDQRSTVVYVPVLGPTGDVAGLVNLVFRAGALLDAVAPRVPDGTDVRWLDTDPELPEDARVLADAGEHRDGGATATETMDELGRTWQFEASVSRSALGTLERRVPWLIALLGLVLCLGLAATSVAWRSTARRADALAAKRTAALATATEELEATNRELLELDRFKDRLIGSVSHDLRSPLTVIRGIAELLLERDVDAGQRRDLLRRLLRQASRQRGLIDELLVSAQVRAGAVQPDRRPLDLREAVESTVDDLGIGEIVRDRTALPPVLADRVHVERVLHNLLTNAANHGRPPILVGLTRTEDGAVEVSVRDHGPGVAEELRSWIFDEHARLDPSGPGFGLGLAIATELARANGGTLTYREQDIGACFVLTLPAGPDLV